MLCAPLCCAFQPGALSLSLRRCLDALSLCRDGDEGPFLENRLACQSTNHRRNDSYPGQPSIADWGKHSGIRSNHQNSSSLELKHYKAWNDFSLGPCRPSQPVENTPNSQMSVGVLSLPGPRVTDLAGRGGSAQPGDNNDFILPSWERGWGHTAASTSWSAVALSHPQDSWAPTPALCDESPMERLPYVQLVPGRNGPTRLSAKVLAIDSSLLFFLSISLQTCRVIFSSQDI